MFTTVDELVLARAAAMAEQDGIPVGTVHIMGAAGHLQADIISARDRLLNSAAGSAHAGADAEPAPEPVIEPEAEVTAKPSKKAAAAAPAAKDAAE